ncbi:MAG: neutral/alkaline non-lysosomal ceramidase N-terminal domain-containing protein [Acidobacteriota bacterium]
MALPPGETNPTFLLAGTARRCISPPAGIAHGGWGAQRHEQAEGIDMDLWVTVLALADGPGKVVILDLDVQVLTREVADCLRSTVAAATGVAIDRIRASYTHTHSGPVMYKSWIEKGFELVQPWLENVYRLSAEAACEALASLQPAQVRAGRGQCFINVNRRAVSRDGRAILGKNRDGPSDHEVLVVRLDLPEGKNLATLVNYACHPTIMGPPNRVITPDYPGVLKRTVEAAVGGRCLFLQGAAGDQGPVRGFQGDAAVYRTLGATLGHEAAKVALALASIPVSETLSEVVESGAPLGMYEDHFPALPALPLQVACHDILVPLRRDLPEAGAAAEALRSWQETLKAARQKDDQAAIREAVFRARRADLMLRMAEDFRGQTQAGIKTQFICFGDVALVSCNNEPFAKTGLEIKSHSPFPYTLFSGYSNGRMAYMPTEEEWTRGGHEVENSPFAPGAAEAFQREVIATLHTIRTKD